MAGVDITAQLLRTLVHYNPDTGVFTSLLGHPRVPPGARLGHPHNRGYVSIKLKGHRFLAHRLAWLYMTGEMPKQNIDHRNGDKADNRWCNLRDVSQSTNMQNLRAGQRHAKSALLGATWCSRDRVWTAQITVDGKRLHIGSFRSDVEAHEAYVEAKRRHHPGCTI